MARSIFFVALAILAACVGINRWQSYRQASTIATAYLPTPGQLRAQVDKTTSCPDWRAQMLSNERAPANPIKPNRSPQVAGLGAAKAIGDFFSGLLSSNQNSAASAATEVMLVPPAPPASDHGMTATVDQIARYGNGQPVPAGYSTPSPAAGASGGMPALQTGRTLPGGGKIMTNPRNGSAYVDMGNGEMFALPEANAPTEGVMPAPARAPVSAPIAHPLDEIAAEFPGISWKEAMEIYQSRANPSIDQVRAQTLIGVQCIAVEEYASAAASHPDGKPTQEDFERYTRRLISIIQTASQADTTQSSLELSSGTGSNSYDHYVSGYMRSGTYVQPHYQTNPNSTTYDNFGTRGNYNPHTGTYGTLSPR